MRKFVLFFIAILMLNPLVAFSPESDTSTKKIKILLIGDSTTAGGKPFFEKSIEQLIEGIDSLILAEVINLGLGGETAYSLLNSNRYDTQIKGIEAVDYIFLRYGINDWIHRQPFLENFPEDLKKVISHLRNDFPEAQIILMTIIPFLNEENSTIVNESIARVAKDENLELFDIYPAYQKGLDEYGQHSMNVRFFPLSEIPEQYHLLVAPYTKFYSWKNAEYVRVLTTELDPFFGHLSDWYKDKHPNPTGYQLIARETASYFIGKLRDEKDSQSNRNMQ